MAQNELLTSTAVSDGVSTQQALNAADKRETQNVADPRAQESETWRAIKTKFARYYPAHKNQVTWMAVGLITALTLLIAGFWKGLLIIVLVSAGYVYGQIKDGNPRALKALTRMFRRR